MVPSVASGQLVGVVVMVAVNEVLPAATFTLTDPAQLIASVNVTVCGPDATLVNVLLACGGPPSKEYIYGAVPLVGLIVIVPFVESGQVVAVVVNVAVIVVVVLIVKFSVVSQLLTSETTTIYAPAARLLNV